MFDWTHNLICLFQLIQNLATFAYWIDFISPDRSRSWISPVFPSNLLMLLSPSSTHYCITTSDGGPLRRSSDSHTVPIWDGFPEAMTRCLHVLLNFMLALFGSEFAPSSWLVHVVGTDNTVWCWHFPQNYKRVTIININAPPNLQNLNSEKEKLRKIYIYIHINF